MLRKCETFAADGPAQSGSQRSGEVDLRDSCTSLAKWKSGMQGKVGASVRSLAAASSGTTGGLSLFSKGFQRRKISLRTSGAV